jgi:hypothetical protein
MDFNDFIMNPPNLSFEISQNDFDVTVLPCPNMLEGKMGFLFFKEENNKEKACVFHQKICDIKEKHEEILFFDFKKAYEDAVKDNYLVISADNPKILNKGFVVVKGDGGYLYTTKLSEIKKNM